MDQLEYVDALVAKDKQGRVENPPGLYVFYIRDNIVPPADFPTTRKQHLQEEAQQAKRVEHANIAQIKIDYENYCIEETKRYVREVLPAQEYQQLFQQHSRYNRNLFKHMTEAQLCELTERTLCAEIQTSGRVTLLTFKEFGQRQSPRGA